SKGFEQVKDNLFCNIFSQMKDCRTTYRGNLRYPLVEVMFLVISAVVSGANDWVVIEEFGKGQLEWLRRFFPFKYGIPSHDTLGRIFAGLESEQFNACFRQWVNQISKSSGGQVVAIDGKRMRGSYDKSADQSAIHMVSAYAAKDHLCLGQVTTEHKSNEITAIPQLLKVLVLEDCIVTIDAMGCQQAISQQIIDKRANYILGVKENQKGLLNQVEKVFTITAPEDKFTSNSVDHGRVETRTCSVISNFQFFDDYQDWPGIKSLIKVEAQRYMKDSGKTEASIRYYISSLTQSAQQINTAIRDHWAIENKLHWVLDVVFNEDASRKRKGNSAANFNVIT
ncbi:ISAs1 family transposase, partial [Imperialibacter sp. EC-SDR9]|uniref:ISAs1 family transposase n=1 Tax=Imperialibacter sp. EC-SDR9 TaxID=2038371 RepID=UPI00125F7805